MNSRNYIPRKDMGFNQWVNVLMNYLASNFMRFNIPEDVYNSVAALRDNWTEKYSIVEMPSLCTKVSIRNKNDIRVKLESELRKMLREFITYSRFVNDAERESMGLPVHKTSRTAIPVPTTVPESHIDTSMNCRLSFHFRDQGSTCKAKPTGVHGVEIKWDFGDPPPVSPEKLVHSSFGTRTPFMLEFTGEQRGKTIYYCLRWENKRGEKGPWSEIASATIP